MKPETISAHELATCRRKIPYRTFNDAMTSVRAHVGIGVTAYRCGVCWRYHIGKPTGRDIKAYFQRR